MNIGYKEGSNPVVGEAKLAEGAEPVGEAELVVEEIEQ